jgi:hypothetical protein
MSVFIHIEITNLIFSMGVRYIAYMPQSSAFQGAMFERRKCVSGHDYIWHSLDPVIYGTGSRKETHENTKEDHRHLRCSERDARMPLLGV